MKYSIVAICTFILCGIVFSGCAKKESSSKTMTTTSTTTTMQPTNVTYTVAEINKLEKHIRNSRISFEVYKKTYQAVCTRETFCGFYDILLQEDGRRAFVFYDNDYRLYRLLSLEPVKTKQELEDALSKLTSYEQILEVDDNCWSVGSGLEGTVHVVQEGFFTLDSSGEFGTETPFIVKYYSNEDVKNDPRKHYKLPYVLELDRTW